MHVGHVKLGRSDASLGMRILIDETRCCKTTCDLCKIVAGKNQGERCEHVNAYDKQFIIVEKARVFSSSHAVT